MWGKEKRKVNKSNLEEGTSTVVLTRRGSRSKNAKSIEKKKREGTRKRKETLGTKQNRKRSEKGCLARALSPVSRDERRPPTKEDPVH